jgi:hypothetical protein
VKPDDLSGMLNEDWAGVKTKDDGECLSIIRIYKFEANKLYITILNDI